MSMLSMKPKLIFTVTSLLLVVSGTQANSTAKTVKPPNDAEAQSVCHNLMDGSDHNNLNILTIGLLPNSLLLITKNLYVFDLPPDSMRGHVNSSTLYLGAKNPVHISKKWPNLTNYEPFQLIVSQNLIYNSFTITDEKGAEFLLFVTKKNLTKEYGVKYNLNTGVPGPSYHYTGQDDQVMQSASKKTIFYALHEDNGYLEMVQFKIRGSISIQGSRMYPVGSWQRLCSGTDGTIFFSASSDGQQCNKGLTLKAVLRGFIDDGRAVLMGSLYIYTFDLSALHEPGKMVPLGRQRYNDFLVCQPDMLKYALIGLGAFLLLLLLLLLLCYYCCRKKKSKPPTTAEKKPKKLYKKKKTPTKQSKKGKSNKSQYTSDKGNPTKRSGYKSRSKKQSNNKSHVPKSQEAALTRRSKRQSKKVASKSKKKRNKMTMADNKGALTRRSKLT